MRCLGYVAAAAVYLATGTMAVFVLDPPSAAVLKRQNGDESPVLKREYAAVPLPCSSVPGHSTTHLTTTMAATTTVYHAITVYRTRTVSRSRSKSTASSSSIYALASKPTTYPTSLTTSTPCHSSSSKTTSTPRPSSSSLTTSTPSPSSSPSPTLSSTYVPSPVPTYTPSNTTSKPPPVGGFSTGVITYPRNVTVPSPTSTPLVFSSAGSTLQASALITGLVSLTALLLI
ncbi:hypothetical protein MBM_05246 [Drepanopeziza brunnea f. sp. 'multigermtubi' MB_m1]|uniref:Uncharacterized protein n=1 Tax=Marssonina brunnea f. sp. multigermtubi (strain MB_m1) TaxID=1072389 RepID=K1WWC2_MARBU|nr:uncharacterized protein MBM_05246 [Drepanopeziza brunnea f. sp. 'multigermtubi' MB_m1]EKD16777.1 hypothetical protein MBM_05246 [Drepanopeziza brunnea f. sp. 'multigermtubi' MB_m1]